MLPVTARGRGLRYARWAKRFLTFAELPEEEAFRRSYSLYDPAELSACSVRTWPRSCRTSSMSIARSTRTRLSTDHVNRMCLADARMFLPGLNLAYTDRASMAASTEVRVPFVDPIVARAAFSLPGSAKVRHRRQKGRAERGGRSLAAQRDRQQAEGFLQRATTGLGRTRTAPTRRRRPSQW